MTAPRITVEEIASYEQRLADEDITFDFVRGILDDLKSALSELDRLSAQGGEVPERAAWLTIDEMEHVIERGVGVGFTLEGRYTTRIPHNIARMLANAIASASMEKAARIGSRPAHPHPDTVEVPRDKLEQLVKRFLELAETVGQIKELAKIDERHLQDAAFLRAHAQPATERSI